MPVKSAKSFGVKALGQGLGADAEATDAEFNQVTTLLHADGSEGAGDTAELGTPNYKAFIDNSASEHPIAINADAYGNNFSPYTLADGYWSTTFDGNANNHIRYQGYRENDSFNLDDRAMWCIDFWLFMFNNAVAYQRVAEMYNSGGFWAIKFSLTGNGKLCIGASDASNDGILDTGDAIPEGRWVHVALTNDFDNRLRWFVDGRLSARSGVGWNQPWSNNASTTSHTQIQLGNYRGINNYQLRGSLSNFRIVQGSVPSAFKTTSTSLDTTIFSKPTAPTSDPYTDGELSVYFDGSNDYLSVDDTADFTFGSGDFTIECWIYFDTVSGTKYVYGQSHGSAGSQTSVQMYFSNGTLYAWTGLGSANATIKAKQWYHVAFVRQSNTLRLYLQGVQEGTQTISGSITDSSGIFAIGRVGAYNAAYFQGFVSNLNIIKGTAKYPDGTTFSVPTGKTTAHANTVLLTCQSKRFVDNSTNQYRVKPNNEPIVSEFHPFDDGYWSVHLNSTSDKIQVTSSSLPSGSSNRTVEFWAKVSGNPDNTQYFFSYGNNQGGGNFSWARNGSGYFAFFGYGTGNDWATSTTVPLEKWFHVSLTSNGSQVKFYLNGTLTHTQNYSTSTASVSNLYINQQPSGSGFSFANLKISNFIIYSSIERTGNFTAPTSPETNSTNVEVLVAQSNREVDNSSNSNTVTFTDAIVDDDIPFELLSRQTKLLTCRSFTHQDIIPDRFSYNAGKTVSTAAAVPFITPNNPFSYTSPDNVGSGYFDGSNDGIFTSTDSDFAFGTGNFTFEAWVYPKSAITSGTKVVLDLRYSNNGNADNLSALVWTGQRLDNYSAGSFSSDTDLARFFHEGTWNHICVQRIGNVLYHSVNGYMSGSNPAFTRTLSGNGKVSLGGNEGLSLSMFTGYIADLRITKTAVYGNRNFQPPSSSLSALTDTKFLTCQYSGAVRNQGITDESKWRHRMTRFGDAKIGTFSPFSLEDGYWSWYFDGNNPVEIADANSGLDLTGDFTVEFWAYEPKLATTNGTVNMYFTIDTLDRFQVGSNTSNLFVYMNGGNTLNGTASPLGQWNHIALVRSGSGSNNVSLYRNGSRLAQGTNTTSLAAGSLMLGGQDRGGTSGYHGSFMYMSNFRILKGTALYSGTSYTVPSSPLTAITNTSLLTCQSHRFRDNSTNNMTHTTYYTEVQAFSPFAPSRSYSKDAVGGSIHLDGSGDWVQINANKDINVLNPTSTYTLEGWFYVDIDSPGTRYIISKGGTGTGWSATSSHYVLVFLYNNSIYIQVKIGAGSLFSIIGAHGSSYQWNHFAVGYNGTTHRMWYNGSSIGTNTSTPFPDTSTNGQNMFIGVSNNGSTSPFAGYISNIRYVRGTDIYGVSNSSITVPTAPPTNVANTNFLTNFTNGAIIDHSMKNNLETEGNTRIRTDIKKYGTGSIFFDGVSDVMVQRKGRMTLNFNTEKFTIEFWCLVPSDASANSLQMFVSTEGGSWSGGAISWYTAYSGNSYVFPMFVADYSGGAPMLTAGSTSLKDGNWHHHAVVRGASGACAYFLDGTRKSTATFTGNVGSATRDAVFGGLGTSSRNSKFFLDDFRVTRGVARYDPSQTSVTIPTSAFANR